MALSRSIAIIFFSLLIRQVLDALLGVEVELAPYPFIGGIVETEGMLAIEMHMPNVAGMPLIGHYDGGLMEGLRKQRPEVPVILGRAHACARVPLLLPG